jgi:hypothetical protein
VPIGGYFLTALFSGGRQSAFQVMLFAVLTPWVNRARGAAKGMSGRGALAITALALAMVGYMGFVAWARNDGLVSDDKTEVLSRLFDFQIMPEVTFLLDRTAGVVKTTVVEAAVYFSSPIALFSRFLSIDYTEHTYGAMSLPFIFRQIEPLTGISVVGALQRKRELMDATGVIGAGWTTGVSSYIIDFGLIGAGVVMVLQGFYSAHTWRRAIGGGSFHDRVVAIIMLINAIYLPFLAASGETNLLLLWAFCTIASWRTARGRYSHRDAVAVRSAAGLARDPAFAMRLRPHDPPAFH